MQAPRLRHNSPSPCNSWLGRAAAGSGARAPRCFPAMSLPFQPQRGDATTEVSAQVRGKVLHIRLPGGSDDRGGQVYIVLLLRGVALNSEDELLACLRVLPAPLLLH